MTGQQRPVRATVRAATAIAALLAVAPVAAEPGPASTASDAGSGFEANGADPAARLAAAMHGRFASVPDGFGNRVTDFRQVIPALGAGTWVYYQRNQGADDLAAQDKAYRQRVLQLITQPDGSVVQVTWSLKEPDGYAAAPRDPSLLRTLRREALTPTMAPGCEQIWYFHDRPGAPAPRWDGTVDPQQCTIFSKRRQQRIRIGSDVRLTPRGLQEAERGLALDGTQIWGTPQGAFTVMDRVTDP